MDHLRDAKPFQELTDELHAIYRDGFKAPEAWRNAMWEALKDVSYTEVKANAKRLMATAVKGAPLPKPTELRNRAPVLSNPYDPRRQAAEILAAQTWRELRASDPVRYHVEIRIARAARELAAINMLDPGYDDWTREYQQWAALRYAPREAQEAAVARVENQPADWYATQKNRLQAGK